MWKLLIFESGAWTCTEHASMVEATAAMSKAVETPNRRVILREHGENESHVFLETWT